MEKFEKIMELIQESYVYLNRLNNHKDNLEITTQRINSNKQHIKSSSKYTGVYWSKEKQQWIASIKIKNKRTYLGAFDDELDAGKAYQEAINNL